MLLQDLPPAEETVFYSLLAVNASINVVMIVTYCFTQSFNDLNNVRLFWHECIKHFVYTEIK